MLSLVLGAALLIKSDIAAMQSSKLPPNATNNIAAMADSRPVILGRATFATYVGGAATPPVLMSVQFDGGILAPGDQFTASVSGTASNNSAAAQNILCYAQVTQGLNVQIIGFGAATAVVTGGTAVAWRCDIMFGVNIPGSDGQYIAQPQVLSSGANAISQNQARGRGIGFAGSGMTLITNTTLTGGVYAGGAILAGASASSIQATKSQLVYNSNDPIRIDILLGGMTASGALWTSTVQSGYMLGL